MEQKTSKSNNFIRLLLNAIKNKKSWFLISLIIIFTTTVIIPYIVKNSEPFLVLGIIESFIIIFLNCMIDNNFLHSDSKLAYYKSKPVSFEKQIFINIVTNILLACFLMIIISISMLFNGADYIFNEVFKFIIPWMIVGILIASLSSVLTGNTIVAGVMTVFNFILPLLIYLVIMFVFVILEDIVIGFSANILMDSITYKVYRLDYLYFTRYLEPNSIDVAYFCMLLGLVFGLTILIKVCIKNRKNENTGNFIVSDGYKYFVSVFASLIIPAIFAMAVYGVSIGNKIFVFAILAVLSYYVIIAVLEKSFRISILSIKLFLCFMIVFIVLTGGTISVANRFKNSVPNENDVKMAYIGDTTWVYSDVEKTAKNVFEIDEGFWNAAKDTLIFTDKQNIKIITQLHKELLKDRNYNSDLYFDRVVISYMMKNGRVIVREYNINQSDEDKTDRSKDNITRMLINNDEFKTRRFYYLYNDDFVKNNELHYKIDKTGDRQEYIGNGDYDGFKISMQKDIDKIMADKQSAFEMIFKNLLQITYQEDGVDSSYHVEITYKNSNGDEIYLTDIYIDENFENTFEFIRANEN